MNLNDYKEQYKRNLQIMSRTANGNLDVTASTTKKDSMAITNGEEAKNIVLENVDRAIEFLFENRDRKLTSAKDLENLILKTAQIINNGIVKEDKLFRSGEDSIKYPYARIKDIPLIWNWFIHIFYCVVKTRCFDAVEIAAFAEYVINEIGHFFSDGCGKISMLISMYIFMCNNLPCAQYTSREEYYQFCNRSSIPTVSELRGFFADREFKNFLSYYRNIHPTKDNEFFSHYELQSDGTYLCRLEGWLTQHNCRVFLKSINSFYKKHGQFPAVFECSRILGIDLNGIQIFKNFKALGKQFVLKNLNVDCMVLFITEGLGENVDRRNAIPKLDLTKCTIIGEGQNGIIYRVTDDTVAKVYKGEPNYNQIIRGRLAMKNALICGIPVPISLGYAECDGKIATLMELIQAESLMKIISREENPDEYIIRYAKMIKDLHGFQDNNNHLTNYIQNQLEEEILDKAGRIDKYLPEKYKGSVQKIIEAIDEPACLVHGDIQPNNIMVSKDEMLFIDFDSFSSGRAVYDLGGLYRTLFGSIIDNDREYSHFLNCPISFCKRIWDVFIDEYYRDAKAEIRQKNILIAKMIGIVLRFAKLIKNEAASEILREQADELIDVIDEYDSLCCQLGIQRKENLIC